MQIHELCPQQIRNVVWGLRKIKQQSNEDIDVFVDGEELVSEIVRQGMETLEKLFPQNP